MYKGSISDSSVKIWDREDAKEVHCGKYYGKLADDGSLDMSPVEAMHLIKRGELQIENDGEKVPQSELYERFSEIDDEFDHKYKVYSDLRDRGFIVKSGFKFGAHFRVYPRGVNPYKDGPKKQKEHTKWVVHAVPENHTLSFQEMSRAVRLAQNIRAQMLWAVVDSEIGVTYYEVEHITP